MKIVILEDEIWLKSDIHRLKILFRRSSDQRSTKLYVWVRFFVSHGDYGTSNNKDVKHSERVPSDPILGSLEFLYFKFLTLPAGVIRLQLAGCLPIGKKNSP